MSIMSEDISKLALALSKAQESLVNVKKDKSGYNYKYADLASCLDIIKEPLGKNELSISQIVNVKDGETVLETLLMHSSGQWLKSTFPINFEASVGRDGKKSMNIMQELGSGISYARRYALSAIVGLAQDDDDAATAPTLKQQKPVSALDETLLLKKKKLKQLCDDNGINVVDFAYFHKINKIDINLSDLSNIIYNFDERLKEFVDAKLDKAI